MVTSNKKTEEETDRNRLKENMLQHWEGISMLYRQCLKSNTYVSVASVDANNVPTVSPIGSLLLNRDGTGFFFEKFTSSIAKNTVENPHICVLAVNSSFWYWLTSLFKGKFPIYPSIKLYGRVGEKREAKPEEKVRFLKRVKAAKGTKGYTLLWEGMSQVREIDFYHFETTKLGAMTKGSKLKK